MGELLEVDGIDYSEWAPGLYVRPMFQVLEVIFGDECDIASWPVPMFHHRLDGKW